MSDAVIEVDQLRKHFGPKPALRGVSLRIQRGEMVALLGASGSGKSTLLRHMTGLHRSDPLHGGMVSVLGESVQIDGIVSPKVRRLRARVAMIFQQFNLVDRLPVMGNVLAGALHRTPAWRWATGRFNPADVQRAHAALARVGMEGCAWQRASTLSGGQQQRAAIARAMVQEAEVVLADEPIASLDPESSRRVMTQLADLNRDNGVTVLVSLHQVEHAFAHCPRTIALRAGEVVHDGPTHELTPTRLRDLYGSQIDELVHDVRPQRPAAAAMAGPRLQAA